MPRLRFLVLFSLLGTFALPAIEAKSLGWNADALKLELASIDKLPAAPAGVADLKFSDFYVMPIGDRGLELTGRIRQLDGKRVRILGFMVRQTQPAMGGMMLTSYAATTHEGEYGLCDDLPAAVMFVDVPKYRGIAVPFTPGPLLLTGTLELGRREEADGRVSFVRLRLDADAPRALAAP